MEVKTTKEVTKTFGFCYDEEVLDGTGVFIFDYYDKNMDGIFPNKASWTRFVNRVDNGELVDKLVYKRKGDYIKKIDYNTIEVYFEHGLSISTGYLLDDNNEKIYIYDKYKTAILEIDYEFYYWKGHDLACEIEISAKIKKLIK